MRFQFEEYEVSEYGLTRNGQRLPLEPTPLAVLLYLVVHRHRQVLNRELAEAVWPGVHNFGASQHRAISQIRKTLNDPPGPTPKYVKTFARTGHQFVAEAIELPPDAEVVRTIEHVLRSALPGEVTRGADRSVFIRDVTIPDGAQVRVNERFTKRWELKNGGEVPWVNRFLVRVGPTTGKGRLQSLDRVPIPTTLPGQHCIVSVDLVAPSSPGSCEAHWKMTDEHGQLCFPGPRSVFVSVDVVHSTGDAEE
jgi:DNA-binding winged helix-turn-helix (wHTH) protein